MPNQEKVEDVRELKARLAGVKTAVLTEYRGLTVQQLSNLRKQLRSVAAEYTVVKNRLARLAVAESPLERLGPHLKGPTGLAISERDPVALAKALQAFVKANPLLQIKLGYVDGQLLEPAGIRTLADLPPREALRGRLVGAIQGPLAQLVGLLTAPHRELVYILQQRGKDAAE